MPVVAHRLFLGSFPSLEDRFARWTGEARSDPLEPLDGLVPSNAVRRRLGRVLLGDRGGWVNVRLRTFLDLAREAAGAGPPLLSEAERLALLRQALSRLQDEGYRERAGREGFVRGLLAAISDLREAGARAPAGTPLAEAQAAFEEALRRGGATDREGLIAEAAARLAAAPPARGPEGPLAVYGFYDLNVLQRRLLEALAARRPLAVFFPRVDGEAGAFSRPALDWFRKTLRLEAEDAGGGGPSPPARVAARLFLPPGEAAGEAGPAERGAVRVRTASGPVREAEAVARALLEEHARGTDWEEMAVLVREEELRDPLHRALEAWGIPFRSSLPEPLLREPVAAAVAAALRCIQEGFPWRAASQVLGSPYLRLPRGDGRRSSWPALIRASGVVGGGPDPRAEWEEGMARLESATAAAIERRRRHADDEDAAGLRALAENHRQVRLLRGASARLLQAAASLPARGLPSQLAATLRDLAETWFAVPEDGPQAGTAREAQALEEVLGHLSAGAALDRVLGEVPIGRVAAELRLRVEAVPFERARPPAGGVRVLPLMRARGLIHEVVVLPGLQEGGFPRAAPAGPFPSPPSEAAVGRPERRLQEERLLFALSLASARRRAVLVLRRSDGAGRERSPSPFLREVHRALYGPLVLRPEDLDARLREDGVLRHEPVSALEEARRDGPAARPDLLAAAELHEAFAPGSGRGHVDLAEVRTRRALVCEEARLAPRLSPWDGVVGPAGGLAPAGVLSPTRFERYGRCPFQYFAHDVLALEPPASHTGLEEFSPLEHGSLAHDALERLYRSLAGDGLLPLDPQRLAEARRRAGEVVEEVLARRSAEEAAHPPLLRERERRRLHGVLLAVLDWESGQAPWVPRWFETSFGMEGEGEPPSTPEPLVFTLPGGEEIRFRGRMDRMDVDEREDSVRVRILDYKTGKGAPRGKVKPWEEDRYQLLLYRMAAGELLLDGVPPSGIRASYLFVETEVRERSVEEFDEERLHRTVRVFHEGIRDGLFFLRPGRHCDWCDYRTICRREPVRLTARKVRADEAARPYLEIKEGGA